METDSEPLQEVDFWQLQDEIQARRDALGITDADDMEMNMRQQEINAANFRATQQQFQPRINPSVNCTSTPAAPPARPERPGADRFGCPCEVLVSCRRGCKRQFMCLDSRPVTELTKMLRPETQHSVNFSS